MTAPRTYEIWFKDMKMIFVLDNEELVNNQENMSKLIEHCELE